MTRLFAQQTTSSDSMRRPPRRRPDARRRARLGAWLLAVATALAVVVPAPAQTSPPTELGPHCTASVLNRTVPVQAGGFLSIPNIPVQTGRFRVRVTCVEDGVTTPGQSAFLELSADGVARIGPIELGVVDPIPAALAVTAPSTVLSAIGETLQLTATATLPGGGTRDLTRFEEGTLWRSSNPAIASVDPDGLLIAQARGEVIVQARNEGVLGALVVQVVLPEDADGDGLPDVFEEAVGLDPHDAADAALDPDGDGLDTLDEFGRGTVFDVADSDGDGIDDGAEVAGGTDPLAGDSDGDGALDGAELAGGTDPLAPDSDGDGLADGVEIDLGLDPLVADPTTTVTVRLVDGGGVVLDGATATVFDHFSGRSDGAGVATLAAVPAGLGDLVVSARSIVGDTVLDGASAPVAPLPAGVTDAGTIVLEPVAGEVTGSVRGPSGSPVPNARVTVTSGPDARAVQADAGGVYRADRLPPGTVDAAAVDPATGLRGRASGELPASGSAVVDIELGASGTVRGTVRAPDGLPVVAGVTVTLSGPATLTTETAEDGSYEVAFAPLGSYAVDAVTADGGRGRSHVTVTRTSEEVVADVLLLGRGRVQGIVLDALGLPVAGAEVDLFGRSLFEGRQATTTDASGAFAVDGVFVGSFDVFARLAVADDVLVAGRAVGRIESDGESIDVTVMLRPSGAVTGTVFEADGTTPVPGATLVVESFRRRLEADAQGVYRIDGLHPGSYTLVAIHPGTGDRAQQSVLVARAGDLVATDLTMRGTGALTLTVVDGDGVSVEDAEVGVSPEQATGLVGRTDAAGRVDFPHVVAGPYTVSARDPASGLAGAISSSLRSGASHELTVGLEDAGSLRGTVLAADGVTPRANVVVRLSPGARQVVTGADGAYSFDLVPVARGPYSLQAIDDRGVVRATAADLVLDGQGDLVVRDLSLSAVGRVVGTVRDAAGLPVAAADVTLQSTAVGAMPRSATSDAAGAFRFDRVPAGAFTLRASSRVLGAAGSVTGVLQDDAEELPIDLSLVDPLPPGLDPVASFADVHGFAYDVQRDGAIRDGTNRVFVGDDLFARGGLVLEVDGEAFQGGDAAFELADRHVLLPAARPLSGLEVRRRVYVPDGGYFARYLELFENPTDAPITVDLRLRSSFGFTTEVIDGFSVDQPPRLVLTSSGDATLVAGGPSPDRWAVIDDHLDQDPAERFSRPTVAHVFDGAGGALAAGEALFVVDDAMRFGRLETVWRSVTVAPGETVALLHFAVQQTTGGSARAAAERLVQLPPEALAGLDSAVRAQVLNFDLPADGVSALAPLPSLDGVVTGTVLEGDGLTPVADAFVRWRSDHPLFDRVHTLQAGADGRFTLAGVLGGSRPLALPRHAFRVEAAHPATGLRSPASAGDFDGVAAEDAAIVDLVFSDGGRLTGTVRRPDGVVASHGSVVVEGGGLLDGLSSPFGADGRFTISGLAGATYTLTATLPSGIRGVASAAVVDGEETVADITLDVAGTIVGTVRDAGGVVVPGLVLELRDESVARSAQTDTAGAYALVDLAAGDYSLRLVDPATGDRLDAALAVVAGETTVHDIELPPVGVLDVRTVDASGTPLRARISFRSDDGLAFFRPVGVSDDLGRLRITGLPLGAYTVRAEALETTLLVAEAGAVLGAHGDEPIVSLTVPQDAEAPTVSLTAPAPGGDVFVGAPTTVVASAADDVAVQRVDFLVDGEVVAFDTTVPYSVEVSITAPAAGDLRVLEAVAHDAVGRSTRSAPVEVRVLVDSEPPTVALTTPAPGATVVEGTSLLTFASADDNVVVERVDVFLAGALVFSDIDAPYGDEIQLASDLADGGPVDLELRAVAVDGAGLSAADALIVTVLPDQPPTLELLEAPADLAQVVEGTSVLFRAAAADDVAVEVDFLVDGTLLDRRTQAPFDFVLDLPAHDPAASPLEVTLVARDTQGQTAATAPVRLVVVVDQPPAVALTAPADGVERIEGETLSLVAVASDDVAIERVDFFVAGVLVASDIEAPFSSFAELPAGADLDPVEVRASAVDTSGQTVSDTVTVVRRDDVVAPTVTLTAPVDGAVVSLGRSDLVLLVERSAQSCGADVDGDGDVDSVLECAVAAARHVLDAVDPATTQVAVVRFKSGAELMLPLTADLALAHQVLDEILADGPAFDTTAYGPAIELAIDELAGPRARRSAAASQVLLARNGAAVPSAAVARAADAAIPVHALPVSNTTFDTMGAIAFGTGGLSQSLATPDEILPLLPSILPSDGDTLTIEATADDDIAVQQVTARARSADGAIDASTTESTVDDGSHHVLALALPPLTEAVELELTVTARDAGENEATDGPVTVTVLPALRAPEIIRIDPYSGEPGDTVRVLGTFFAPLAASNQVFFNGLPATILGGDKFALEVVVPQGAIAGPVTVEADGMLSTAEVFFGADSDGDGLVDAEELALGTDPLASDSDGDFLSDFVEVRIHGTDPLSADTDGDTLQDSIEIVNGLDPLDPSDAAADFDGDGLSNADELALGLPLGDPDADDDGLSDGDEVLIYGTEPSGFGSTDTDHDGLSDGDEVHVYGTEPLLADSDGDGMDDAVELALGFDPLDAADALADADGDGLSNGDEVVIHATDPFDADSDGDALPDGDEVLVHGTDPARSDTDDGGRNDGNEVLDDGTDPLVAGDDSALPNSGDLILLDGGASGAVLRVTPDGRAQVFVERAAIDASTGATSGFGAFRDRGLAVGADGSVFFSDGPARSILARRPDGALELLASEAALIAATGAASADPQALAAADGVVYALDAVAESVLRVDATTGAVDVRASRADLLLALAASDLTPVGLTAAPGGVVYLSVEMAPLVDAVVEIAADGSITVLLQDAELNNPEPSMARSADGGVLVSNDRGFVHRVDASTGERAVALEPTRIRALLGNGSGGLRGGFDVAPGGALVVAESGHHAVLRFPPDGLGDEILASRTAISQATGSLPLFSGDLVAVPRLDRDGDGLFDDDEVVLGTEPDVVDTDSGGRTDGEEVLVDDTDPLDPADDLVP